MATGGPVETLCMACDDATCSFRPLTLQRRPVGPRDLLVEMHYCGVCHSDLHVAAGHFSVVRGPVQYPCVPGHELAGVCVGVGDAVSKFKVGDKVGIGCLVDACLECAQCKAGSENNCKKRVPTYQGKDWSGRAAMADPSMKTAGGYTSMMVVQEAFAIRIPDAYPLEYAGPVLCAGITLYDPLKAYGAGPGSKVGIVGLGGLGTMGVKLAKAAGCEVTAISRSEAKSKLAFAAGADGFIPSSDTARLKEAAGSLDLVLNTVPSLHDTSVYTKLLNKKGTHVLLGAHAASGAVLLLRMFGVKTRVTFSGIGGIPNTQEVMELCAKADIKSDIEIRPVQDINRIYELLDQSNDAGVRYVLDLRASLKPAAANTQAAAPTKLNTHRDDTIRVCPMLGQAVKQLLGRA